MMWRKKKRWRKRNKLKFVKSLMSYKCMERVQYSELVPPVLLHRTTYNMVKFD